MVDCEASLPALRTAADHELHKRIVPQPVEVDCILVPAGNRQNTRHHHFEHRMPDAVRIAAIWHCFGEPQANTMFALRLPQKQHATIGRLAAAGKSTVSCCHPGLIREATGGNTSLLRESGTFRNRSLRNLISASGVYKRRSAVSIPRPLLALPG